MNFSLALKDELIMQQAHSACCKRAYAAGVLFDLREMRENCLVLVISSAAARRECARVYREQYRREALLNGSVMLFASEKLYASYRNSPQLVCKHCMGHFWRGLLVSCGSVTDPEKAFHLEFRLSNPERVPQLAALFDEMGWEAGCRNLDGGVGFYFKKSAAIEAILGTAGAKNALFSVMNAKIARDIRNAENRATNCVTQNIAKSVTAAARCCEAIEKIKRELRFEAMPAELRETAELRLSMPDATLSELAQQHNPPITKSGLNHRLQKILALAGESDKL